VKWETVIGLETHAQLSTKSKMFSGAATAFGAAPNTQACAVDIALPGVLPVVNKTAVECAIRFGLAVGGADGLSRRSVFARKNYFYPDLPKGYQISQYELPVVKSGEIPIVSPTRGEIRIRLTRAHLEEDAGKSLHEGFHDFTGIDLNRAGIPLLEIVSEPDMRSAEEAVAYARALHALVRWIGICDGNMQEGSFRCDANVSVRPAGTDKLGTRREIKNLNSFRFLQQAIEFEANWQIETLENGGRIEQETVLFNSDTGETRAMRSKEEAHDYRYFPDPDLLPLVISEDLISRIAESLVAVGTPQVRKNEYVGKYGLTDDDAWQLVKSRETADYFERVVARLGKNEAKLCANWMNGELAGALNHDGLDIEQSRVSSGQLVGLLMRLRDGTLSGKMAKEVFDAMWAGEGDADAIIAKRGLKQISDSGELERICDQVIAANARQVEDYRAGKDKAFNSLVGQVMKLTKGKANPQQVSEILRHKLAE
jgi:aspartyl-tRNA(Asn)/glutamyl-tRNA(Gln) amidotransferase subunit B